MADIYLLDGTNLAYRSFYAISRLSTSDGRPTNAVYGFAAGVLKILREYHPDAMAAIFDVKGKTFRHEAYDQYKAHRKPMPDDLSAQLPVIHEFLALLGVKVFAVPGCEADDVLATLALRFSARTHTVRIVTSDKDALQLLSDRITILHPADNMVRDTGWLRERYGLTPAQVPDLLALAGDQSDNIPGIRGIGEKTGLELLHAFESLDGIYDHLDDVKKESLRKKLIEGRPDAFLSRDLARLKTDLSLAAVPEDLAVAPPAPERLSVFLADLEFSSLGKHVAALFPQAADTPEDTGPADALAFSDRTIVPFEEILSRPEEFKQILENLSVEKYGFDLKTKALALAHRNIMVSPFSFDCAIAGHLTGAGASTADIFTTMAKQREELSARGMEELFYRLEMPLIPVLLRMEMNGIMVNREALHELGRELSTDLARWEDRIYATAGETFNINSSPQVAQVLFERLGLKPRKKTKTGFSTDGTVLEELSTLHPLPKMLLEYRELFKLKTTYADGLDPFINPADNRIHPTFNQTATSTGRLSCSNPNLQNLPVRTDKGSRIRRVFCAPEGHRLLSFDYNQIELRLLAHYTKDAALIAAFREGKDIHRETAHLLFGEPSLFAGDGPDDRGDIRRMAKTINFGIIYGMSPFGLSRELGISPDEAKRFITEYFRKFPGVKDFFADIEKRVTTNGYVSTLLGRRRYFSEFSGPVAKNLRDFALRAAINMPLQGSAADMIKRAMLGVHDYLASNRLRTRLILQVHDELLFETPDAEREDVGATVKRIMEEALSLEVPVIVDRKEGKNYLDMTVW